jgi:hypothetical protein
MIRKIYTNAIVDIRTQGSMFILPALFKPGIGNFDFVTNTEGKSIMLKIDGFCIICVLNDSCAANSKYNETIARLTGPLTPIQLREVFCHASYININLKQRPQYFSIYDNNNEKYYIHARVPEYCELIERENVEIPIGELLTKYCSPMIGKVDNKEQILIWIKEGKYNFLFDETGEFINHAKN